MRQGHWANTGTYETVATYIRMNFDGLKDDVIRLLAGESCSRPHNEAAQMHNRKGK